MTQDLLGKCAVITGGGSGIGKGIAAELCTRGARVALLGRRQPLLATTAAELQRAGGHAIALQADVTDPQSLAAAMAAAARAFSGLDILVNNAGVGGPNACAQAGPERWDVILRTNVDGVFHSTRAAVPHLRDGGRIVTISSVLGRFGVPGYTAYCTSKHAVIGFTKALALELAARRITVNAVCPGWVETDMAKQGMELLAQNLGTDYADARRTALAAVPIGRILEPREVGATVAWLCSEGAAGVTGQAIVQCGGQVMW